MRITDKSVLVETTSRIGDCLEQGGVCGRVEAYPLDRAMELLDMTRDELELAEPDWDAPGYEFATIRNVLETSLTPRVIRRGVTVE